MPRPDSAQGLIAGGAEEGKKSVPAADLGDLADRLTKMELGLETLSLSTKYQVELAEYVKDLRAELRSVRTARKAVGGFALLAAAVLFIGPIWIAAHNYSWFSALPPYVAAALLIGMFAAGVLLLSTMARSIFRSAAERQGDEFVPPQIKLIYDLMNGGK